MIEVVAAIIELDGKLLAFKRGLGEHDYISYKFEFPGGKVKQGESHQVALTRELREELSLEAKINQRVCSIDHAYPDFAIRMHCYLVRLKQFDARLTEHTGCAHVSLGDADELDWVEADRPVLKILREGFSHVFAN